MTQGPEICKRLVIPFFAIFAKMYLLAKAYIGLLIGGATTKSARYLPSRGNFRSWHERILFATVTQVHKTCKR